MLRLIVAVMFAWMALAQTAVQDKAAFEKVCGACHATSLIDDLKSGPEWEETVGYMVDHGAKGTPEQMAAVMRHLARNFTRVNVNVASAAEIALVLGVDSSVAQALVNDRSRNGKFTDIEALKRVPGLTAAKIRERKDRVAFR